MQASETCRGENNAAFLFVYCYAGSTRRFSTRAVEPLAMESYDVSLVRFYSGGALRFKVEVELRSPGSRYYDGRCHTHFSRSFHAFKASIDEFRDGCRPYISVDSIP